MSDETIPVQVVAEQVKGLRSELQDFKSETRRGFNDVKLAISTLSFVSADRYLADTSASNDRIGNLESRNEWLTRLVVGQVILFVMGAVTYGVFHK